MPRFTEVQKLSNNRIAKLGLVGLLLAAVGAAFTLVNGQPVGTLIGFVVCTLVGGLLFFGKMTVEVRDDALYVQFFPLTKMHRFRYDEISSCVARDYKPIREFGGWGVRFSLRHGKAYNVSGSRGVQLVFTNGKKLLLGSQQSDQLAAAINEAVACT